MTVPAKDYLDFEKYYELVTKFGEQAVQKAASHLLREARQQHAITGETVRTAFVAAHAQVLEKTNLTQLRTMLEPHFQPQAHAKPDLTLNADLTKGLQEQFKQHPALDYDVSASIAKVVNDFIQARDIKDIKDPKATQELADKMLNQYQNKLKARPSLGQSHKKKLEQEYTPTIKLTR